MNSTSNEILPEGYKMTELGALPEEWEVINLDEIIDLKRGISWRKDEANKEGNGIPVIGIPNIKENGKIDFIDTYFLTKDIPLDKMLRINDILFVGSSGSLKNIGRNVLIREMQNNKFTYASFTFLGRVNPLKANSEYIFYLLNSPIVDYNKYARRASDGKYNFQLTQFKNEQKLPLPPLPEQKKIAAVLSAVQEAKEKTQAVIDATKSLKKSMMKHLFTYGPVSPEETENVPLKETEIGKVPEEWEVVRLGEVAGVNYGKANTKDKGNIPVVGSGGIYSRTRTSLVDYPTIVIGRKGTAGKAWLFLEPCYPSDTTFYLRWKKDIDLKFLYNYMVLNPLSGEHAKTTLPSLQKADLINYLLPLPPLSVQQKIASILSAIDAKIEAEENKKKSLEELFKTVLHNLMTAKIRVNNLEIKV